MSVGGSHCSLLTHSPHIHPPSPSLKAVWHSSVDECEQAWMFISIYVVLIINPILWPIADVTAGFWLVCDGTHCVCIWRGCVFILGCAQRAGQDNCNYVLFLICKCLCVCEREKRQMMHSYSCSILGKPTANLCSDMGQTQFKFWYLVYIHAFGRCFYSLHSRCTSAALSVAWFVACTDCLYSVDIWVWTFTYKNTIFI